MARPTPESFEKRQRERRKKEKRADKLERRLIRNDEKRYAKEMRENPAAFVRLDEDGNEIPIDMDGEDIRQDEPQDPVPRSSAEP